MHNKFALYSGHPGGGQGHQVAPGDRKQMQYKDNNEAAAEQQCPIKLHSAACANYGSQANALQMPFIKFQFPINKARCPDEDANAGRRDSATAAAI